MRAYEEAARLDALRQLRLLDTSASESFDRITRMAGQIFGLPIAAISLTDTDRQWFKSRVGITHDHIARAKAPCAEVAETTQGLVIPDLAADGFYANSPLAQSGIRFYAGAPLITREGHGLGSLCVLGAEPRTASPEELAALADLAAMVMAQIDLQHAVGRVDPVSTLPNRFRFLEDLDDLARDTPGEQRFVVLLDLARADQLNALIRVMGAGYIETLVKESARTLREQLGSARTLYHVAATQFAFLSAPGATMPGYLDVVSAGLAVSAAGSIARFVTTMAAGIVPVTLGAIRSQEILRAAHSAAQDAQAKDSLISVYATSNDSEYRRNIVLLSAFGTALEDGASLRLVYQPRIDLGSRRCVGAEALLRWNDPTLGDVSPAEFIPIVERTTLAKPTTAFVLDTALRQLAAWQACGVSLPLSINISATNLDEDGLVAAIAAALDTHNVAPDMLEVEVTESAMMENSAQSLAKLEALAATGVRVAIDDFGTGHSSLAYLQTLPASVVKIDKSFVDPLDTDDARSRTVIATMISLSKKLGFRVVAEGVETVGAVDTLTRMACDEAQGYVFARPLEAQDVLPWIARFNGDDQMPPLPHREAA